MHDWLKANGRDCTDCGRGSPVAHLARASLLGPRVVSGLTLGTFHATCARILRREAEHTLYSRDYVIYDRADP